MAQNKRGCGCGLVLLAIAFVAAAAAGYKFVWPWWKTRPPAPSGKEVQVHVLDVGQGDSILILSPEGKTALIDTGEATKSKVVLDALKRYNVNKIDLFIATESQTDHIGAAADVLKAVKADEVWDSGMPPPTYTEDQQTASKKGGKQRAPKVLPAKNAVKTTDLPPVKAYRDFQDAVKQSNAKYQKAEPGQTYDLGGGARILVLAPIPPPFTKDQLKGGGNEPNANAVVVRLDYGEFSMLLPADAETQTEDRMINKGSSLGARILKVAHHGSKYATSEQFLKAVKPEVAIISVGEYNRYGQPSQQTMDRLKAANVRLYRTDLQGEISITSKGKDYEIKTSKEGKDVKGDLWAGREGQFDDSARSGFISYGDFGPPPRPRKEKAAKK